MSVINRSRRRQKNADWNASANIQEILNKPQIFTGDYNDLDNKPSLFSGSYNDLSNKPTILSPQYGTFEAIPLTQSGSVTFSSSMKTLRYCKIDKMVTITGALSIQSVSSPSGYFRISGLPFPCGSTTDYMASSGLYINQLTNLDIRPFFCRISHNTSYIYVATWNKEGENNGSGYIADISQFLQATTNMAFSITYLTN